MTHTIQNTCEPKHMATNPKVQKDKTGSNTFCVLVYATVTCMPCNSRALPGNTGNITDISYTSVTKVQNYF